MPTLSLSVAAPRSSIATVDLVMPIPIGVVTCVAPGEARR